MKFLFITFLFLYNFSFSQKIEIVFCADFSGSTNGIVKELQRTVWATVNKLESDNPAYEISLGLVGFGRISFGKENYYSKVIHDLRTPINDIGYTLIKLQSLTNGCEAHPQKAINDCLENISWSSDKSIKKIIIIVGNGGVPLKQMGLELKKARKKNVIVRPVFFKSSSNYSNGIDNWRNFAKQADTELVVSEVNTHVIKFKKYYDESFIVLSGDKLITTYLPYGSKGENKLKRLTKIINELKVSSLENLEEMLIYQSSRKFQGSNTKWDLVDLQMSGDFDTASFNKIDLPFFMQSFTNEHIIRYIELKVKERKLIVSKLRLELSKRNEFLNRKKQKSKHFSSKGGLSIIIQNMIQEYVE